MRLSRQSKKEIPNKYKYTYRKWSFPKLYSYYYIYNTSLQRNLCHIKIPYRKKTKESQSQITHILFQVEENILEFISKMNSFKKKTGKMDNFKGIFFFVSYELLTI